MCIFICFDFSAYDIKKIKRPEEPFFFFLSFFLSFFFFFFFFYGSVNNFMDLKIKEDRMPHTRTECKYLTFQAYLQCLYIKMLSCKDNLSVISVQIWRNSIGFKEIYQRR